ncbi:hypothetical protein BHE74_00053404 [Ensete ventricosum]|nr:hypothetical protein BHE74_00053404 [Ensete ventricosum]RZR84281.1 hypothetical protein BHM03_00011073 [Ensete ventricosum]
MRITWITGDASSPSIVEYGTSPGMYTSSSLGERTSYKYLLYSSGKINHAVIGPLRSNTVYFYRCGGQGPEFQLKTPPSQFPIAFAVVGDLGQTGWTQSTLEHINQCKYDVHLLPGDLSYADYQQHLWDSFGALVQPLASTRPWMVTEGNHEKESILFFKSGFQAYNARWKMPYEESGSTSNLFYNPKPEWSVFREASFGHGELKFVNSTHAFWSWHRNDDDESVESDEVWINSLASMGCVDEKKPECRKFLMAP